MTDQDTLYIVLERSEDELSTWTYGPFQTKDDARSFLWDSGCIDDPTDQSWQGRCRFAIVPVIPANTQGLIR